MWVVKRATSLFNSFCSSVAKEIRLVPSRYLCVFGVREDWGLVEARGYSWEGTKEK